MKQLFLLIIFSIAIVSCDTSHDPAPTTGNEVYPPQDPENPPVGGMVLKTASFTSYEHNLMGKVSLYSDSSMRTFLRLEQFTMSQGPDVRVYLSKSNNYSRSNVVEIATLKEGYDNHAFNIEINPTNYSDQHRFVLVYCLEFNTLFGYAELR